MRNIKKSCKVVRKLVFQGEYVREYDVGRKQKLVDDGAADAQEVHPVSTHHLFRYVFAAGVHPFILSLGHEFSTMVWWIHQ